MAKPEHLRFLKQGVDVWNKWRKEHPKEVIDLSFADLSNVYLRNANLRGATLVHADLSYADLSYADFSEAPSCETEPRYMSLHPYDREWAPPIPGIYEQVEIYKGANISYANLTGARLTRAKFHSTIMDATILGNTDLSLDFAP